MKIKGENLKVGDVMETRRFDRVPASSGTQSIPYRLQNDRRI